MLSVSTAFRNDTQGNTLNIIPLVRITKTGVDISVSTNNIQFDGIYYKPLLLNIPSIKESVDFESRKYKISNLSLTLSNFEFEGERLSDVGDLINAEVSVYWKSQNCITLEGENNCIKVYQGRIRSIKTDDKSIVLTIEDISQESLHRDLPVAKLGDGYSVYEKHKNKPIPFVYGHVDRSPTVKEYGIIEEEELGYSYETNLLIRADSGTQEILGFNSAESVTGTPLYINDVNYYEVTPKTFSTTTNLVQITLEDENARILFNNVSLYFDAVTAEEVSDFYDDYSFGDLFYRRKLTKFSRATGSNSQNFPYIGDSNIYYIQGDSDDNPVSHLFDDNPNTYFYVFADMFRHTSISYDKCLCMLEFISPPDIGVPIYQVLMNPGGRAGASVSLDYPIYGNIIFYPLPSSPWSDEMTSSDDDFIWDDLSVPSNVSSMVNEWGVVFASGSYLNACQIHLAPSYTQWGETNEYIGDLDTEAARVGLELVNPTLDDWFTVEKIHDKDFYVNINGRIDDGFGTYTGNPALALTSGEREFALAEEFENISSTTYTDDFSFFNTSDVTITYHNNLNDPYDDSWWACHTNYGQGGQGQGFKLFRSTSTPQMGTVIEIKYTNPIITDARIGATSADKIMFDFFHSNSENINRFSYAYLLACNSAFVTTYPNNIGNIWTGDISAFIQGYYLRTFIHQSDYTNGSWATSLSSNSFGNGGVDSIMDIDTFYIILRAGDGSAIESHFAWDNFKYQGIGTIQDPYSDGGPAFIGCTDPNALNYNMDEEGNIISEEYPPEEYPEYWTDDGSCDYLPTPNLSVKYIPNINYALVEAPYYNWNDESMQEVVLDSPITNSGNEDFLVVDTLGSGDPSGQTYNWFYEIIEGGSFFISALTLVDSDDVEDNPRTGFILQILNSPAVPQDETVSYQVDFTATDPDMDSVTVSINWEVYGTQGEPLPEEDTDPLIKNPADIIHHLLIEEMGSSAGVNVLDKLNAHNDHKFQDFYDGIEETAGLNWRFGFTQNKKINSKKLIEEIAKNTRLFPKFKNDGSFGFSSIRDFYSNFDSIIKTEIVSGDVINFKFTQTPLTQVYSRVKVLYKKDYADGELKEDTDWRFFHQMAEYGNTPHLDWYNYFNLDEETIDGEGNYVGGQELKFESEYIRDTNTAKALRHFLSGWYMNQHNIVELKLPLRYLDLEIGDVIYFDELLGGLKLNGEDYTRSYVLNGLGDPEYPDSNAQYYTVRNKQVIYPMWMITETGKSIDSIKVKAIQLHDWTGSVNILRAQDDVQNFANFSISNIEATDYDGEGTLTNTIGKLGVTNFKFANTTAVGNIEEGSTSWAFSDINGSPVLYEITSEDNLEINVIFVSVDSDEYPNIVNVAMTTTIDVNGDTFTETITKQVSLYINGDGNMDNSLDILDVVRLNTSILAGLDTIESYDAQYLFDSNEDGVLNILDIVVIVGIILSG